MVGITTLLSFSALLALTVADGEAGRKDKGLLRVTPTTTLRTRDLSKRCQGTCEECFGSGYTQCPSSDYYCYKPGDEYYGIDSCTSNGSSSSDYTSSAAAPVPTTTGSAGDSDFCSGKGATCVSCFGAGYLDCPDNYHCYNPNDPDHDTCDSTGSSSGGSTSTCADQYGAGSIDCGTDSCYNPDEGDVCCADGYHCEGGDTCSTEVGYCCSTGSTSSGCSGSGGGLLSSYSDSSYSYSYSSYSYSYSSYSYSPLATSTDDFNFGSATAGASSDATSTGQAQFGASSAIRGTEVKIAAVVLGIFGVGMLLL